MIRSISVLISVLISAFGSLLLLAVACSTQRLTSVEDLRVASVTVTPATANLAIGSILIVEATPRDSAGSPITSRGVTWSTSNPAIATVTPTGAMTAAVTGVALGTAAIVATSENRSGAVALTVTQPAITPVDTIIVTPSSASLNPGKTVQLTAIPKDAGGNVLTGRTISWFSSNTSLATVSVSGLVTGVAPGVAGISAASESKQTHATITVMSPVTPVTSVVVTPPTASVVAGQTVQLTATAQDANGSPLGGRVVTWSTSNTAVATVSSAGVVTGVSAGSATITATSEGVQGTANVSVSPAPTAPGTVADLAVVSVTENSVTLSFTEVGGGTGLPASYDIRFAVSPISWGSATQVTQGTCGVPLAGVAIGANRICTVQGLAASTSFQFQTVAFRGTLGVDAIFGALSNIASGTTATPTLPVATVTVSPPSASLGSGATQQFTAVLKDANGNTITGRPVTWVSSNSAVATASSSGLVTAVAAGSATITATSEGRSGSAAITVTTAPPGGECAVPRAGWIWCDDFEQDRLSRYFEYDNAGGNFVRATGVGLGGSTGMRARWTIVGQAPSSVGFLHVAFGKTPQSYFRPVDAGTANYRELYWRMYLKHQPGWIGGGADKLARATIFASSSSWAQAMIAHVWSGSAPGPSQNYLVIDPASGTDASGNLRTTTYNDGANLRWLGGAQSTTPIFDANHVGQWHCVEVHVKLNDAEQSNGSFRLWVNGLLEAQRTNLNWVGAFDAYGLNAVFFENYWNAGSPQVQERYFDNIVISTQPIGCVGSAP